MEKTENKNIKVALSGFTSELVEHKAVAKDAVLRLGMTLIDDNLDAESPEQYMSYWLEHIGQADILVIALGQKYGYIPQGNKLSITELEFSAALEKSVTIIAFIMSDDHSIRAVDIDFDAYKRDRLSIFKKRLADSKSTSTFSSTNDFRTQLLRKLLEFEKRAWYSEKSIQSEAATEKISHSPEIYANDRYVPGGRFVGREQELETIQKWSSSSQSFLLIYGIGGIGKSALAWHWISNYAGRNIPDTKGFFWYNCYKNGASIRDFVTHALAYMTDVNPKELNGAPTSKIILSLENSLRLDEIIIVLDGLERILKTGADRKSSSNSEFGRFVDRAGENDFLARLVGWSRSKFIATSRVTPGVIMEATKFPRSSVKSLELRGLDPSSVESILKESGVFLGNPIAMLSYIQAHIGSNPFLIRIMAGVIRNYQPAPGNFDRWLEDPEGGYELRANDFNSTQKRMHLLKMAFADLSYWARTFVGIIAGADNELTYEGLTALVNSNGNIIEGELFEILFDLEERAILNWDRESNVYSLNPIAKGYARNRFSTTDREGEKDLFIDIPPERASSFKLKSLVIENIRCFKHLSIDFEDVRPWTLILGDNGVGKTTLLRCIALGLCDEVGLGAMIEDIGGDLIRKGEYVGSIRVELEDDDVNPTTAWIETWLSIDRFGSVEISQESSASFSRKRLFVCGYGAGRRGLGTGDKISSNLSDSTATLFNYDAQLQNPELVLRRAEQGNVNIQNLLTRVDELLLLPHGSTRLRRDGLFVDGPWGNRTSSGSIGDGYRATLGWILDLLGRALHFRSGMIATEPSGIVLMDEIEHHLHPRWQQELIGRLRRQFPGLQFVATTHSPICAGGLSDLAQNEGTLIRLEYDKNGTIEADRMESLAGMRYDQIITSVAFGLRSARDKTTEELMDQVRAASESGSIEDETQAAKSLQVRSIGAFHSVQDRILREEMLELSRSLVQAKEGKEE